MQTFCQIISLFFVGLALSVQPRMLHAGGPSLQKPVAYQGNEIVTGWLMSEKLDGIRGYWDGKKLLTRQGKKITPPAWFTQNFPPFELDGELWSGRSQFELIQSIVLDQIPSDDWVKITYNLFEVPGVEGDFLVRLKKAQDWFSRHPSKYVKFIPQVPCKGKPHLDTFLGEIEALGGEGVIVKDPGQPYHTGRSPHVLKVKNFSDMEGVVIAVHPGKGKFTGKMGSLSIRLASGIQFKIGTGFSNKERVTPPEIGEIITFKHYGFTHSGKPRFASFLRVRKD